MTILDFEEKLLSRLDIINNPQNKEWWYTGCFDESQNLYFSFFFCRVPFLDNFSLKIFDLNEKEPYVYDKKLFLSRLQQKNKLDLRKKTKDLSIIYYGDGDNGWDFTLKDKNLTVSLNILPTTPPFTKFDNNFINNYSLLLFMLNKVKGELDIAGKTYEITNALGYFDHCFGKVPRRTGWHWLAVQNRNFALVSLINYGPYAQKYTQVLTKNEALNWEWIRLNQEVSFESIPKNRNKYWKLSSCDVDLTIEILMLSKSKETIPPIIPFLVNINHDEFFVRVSGRIKVKNEWSDVGILHGVMEEHFGKW